MSTLYELAGERLALQHKLESMNLDEETIADTLEGDSVAIQAKIEAYGYVIRNRNSFADAINAEIVRLQSRLSAEEKRVASIESWLLQNMNACGIKKIECPAFTISVQDNPPSVEVIDESLIPAAFIRTTEPKPPVTAPDKRAILAELKAGGNVPGCAIKQTNRLVIK